MDTLQITLYDEEGRALLYNVEQIFSMEGTDQLYCVAIPDGGGDAIFLRCNLNEDGEDSELLISDIADTAEYHRVSTAYLEQAKQTAVEAANEELLATESIFTATDVNGNVVNYIIHTIFEDETWHRSYVALQQVDEVGEIYDEISLYRFIETDGKAEIETIPSDMEYERARILFCQLIEQGIEQSS